MERRSARGARSLLCGLALAFAAGCSGTQADPPRDPSPSPSSSSPTPEPVKLTFGVFGPEPELRAYTALARDYHGPDGNVTVEVETWKDRDAAIRAYRDGTPPPDVFLASVRDLAALREDRLTQPVNELLDQRGISFGDDYSRDAIVAFSADNTLSCMPYSVSPMVIYYNTALVDFERMALRGLNVPEVPEDEPDAKPDSWTFEQFKAAAEFATRPARGSRGVYIEPSLAGLSPFVYAGGGQVFDNEQEPASTAFSADDTTSALLTTLTVLRDAQITPTRRQLEQRTPVEMFQQGRLGMIAGTRGLVPELRKARNLDFDVMPIPSISRSATVGDVAGMCLSAETEHVADASDFLVHALSLESVAMVARAGYVVPAHVGVATSDDFLQPNQEPANGVVFNASVRRIVIPPLLDSWSRLERVVAPGLRELVTVTGELDEETMVEITTRIDEASRDVLQPPSTESPSPTPSR